MGLQKVTKVTHQGVFPLLRCEEPGAKLFAVRSGAVRGGLLSLLPGRGAAHVIPLGCAKIMPSRFIGSPDQPQAPLDAAVETKFGSPPSSGKRPAELREHKSRTAAG